MTSKRKKVRPAARAHTTAEVLREKWQAAMKSLTAAEAEAEKQFRHFVTRSKVGQNGTRALRELGQRLERERKKAARQMEGRLARLQGRLNQERRNLGRRVEATVQRALISVNIPSRQEVRQLSRKVDELSRKIDSVRGGRRKMSVGQAARRASR
jgi:poly(hydroxyalkanoate) granule associated protein phasin